MPKHCQYKCLISTFLHQASLSLSERFAQLVWSNIMCTSARKITLTTRHSEDAFSWKQKKYDERAKNQCLRAKLLMDKPNKPKVWSHKITKLSPSTDHERNVTCYNSLVLDYLIIFSGQIKSISINHSPYRLPILDCNGHPVKIRAREGLPLFHEIKLATRAIFR